MRCSAQTLAASGPLRATFHGESVAEIVPASAGSALETCDRAVRGLRVVYRVLLTPIISTVLAYRVDNRRAAEHGPTLIGWPS